MKEDDKLKSLIRRAHREGIGPSHIARMTGFTREWVSKIMHGKVSN